MMVRVIRVEEGSEGTFGAVTVDDKAFCVSLELPDLDNQSNVSNIPPGHYKCRRYVSPKFGMTFQVVDVPDRAYILFHAGNTVKDTHGCILLGQFWDKLRVKNQENRAVLNSGRTFAAFMALLRDVDEFDLEVVEV